MHRAAGEVDVGGIHVLGRGEPALLVELAVVWQIGLRHDAEQRTALDDGGAVVEQAVDNDGQAHHRHDIELAGEVEQQHHALLGTVDEGLLAEQILTRVARQAQFGQHHDLHAAAFGLGYQALYLLHIILYVGHLHSRHGCGHFYKSVFHSFIFCTSFSISVYISAGCSKKSFSRKAWSL